MGTIQTIPMPVLAHMHMDPEQGVPGIGDGALLAELPTTAIDKLIRVGPRKGKAHRCRASKRGGGRVMGRRTVAQVAVSLPARDVTVSPVPEEVVAPGSSFHSQRVPHEPQHRAVARRETARSTLLTLLLCLVVEW